MANVYAWSITAMDCSTTETAVGQQLANLANPLVVTPPLPWSA